MCLALQTRGCAGVVVDGGARDAGEIVELALPVFCRYATPLISAGRWALTAANVPIRVGSEGAKEEPRSSRRSVSAVDRNINGSNENRLYSRHRPA